MPDPTGEDPRIRLAGERTLLAWVRTGLAMMGFGFVVARFGAVMRELAPHHPDAQAPTSGGLSVWIGTTLVVLGVAVNLLAAWEHVRFLRRVDRGEPYRPERWSLAVVVAVVLAACGAVMAAYLLVSNPG